MVKERVELFFKFGNTMYDLSMLTLTRPFFWIKKGVILLAIVGIIDLLIMLPLNILLNVIMLIAVYLPFSPVSGLQRLIMWDEIIKAEKDTRKMTDDPYKWLIEKIGKRLEEDEENKEK